MLGNGRFPMDLKGFLAHGFAWFLKFCTFGDIEMTCWDDFRMILHVFASRNLSKTLKLSERFMFIPNLSPTTKNTKNHKMLDLLLKRSFSYQICPRPQQKKTNQYVCFDLSGFWPNFGVPDLSSWLYIQFCMQNPNLRSKKAESSV